jgi:hypothetical protein
LKLSTPSSEPSDTRQGLNPHLPLNIWHVRCLRTSQ